jgi:hypothetical protein
MTQIFLEVGKAAHIDLPTAVTRALGVRQGDWLRVTVSDERVALVEPVPLEVPAPIPRPGPRPTMWSGGLQEAEPSGRGLSQDQDGPAHPSR